MLFVNFRDQPHAEEPEMTQSTISTICTHPKIQCTSFLIQKIGMDLIPSCWHSEPKPHIVQDTLRPSPGLPFHVSPSKAVHCTPSKKKQWSRQESIKPFNIILVWYSSRALHQHTDTHHGLNSLYTSYTNAVYVSQTFDFL